MTNNNSTHVVTGKVRLSYVHLTEAYTSDPEGTPKFSVTVLVPKSDTDTKARIDAAIQAAKLAGKSGKWNGTIPPVCPIPVYDGDGVRPSDGMPYGAECKGHWVFTASDTRRPDVVDLGLNPILDGAEIYSGMYGRVSCDFFPYAAPGKKGIGCGLVNVQKLADGEPLGGARATVQDDFGAPLTVNDLGI